MTSLFSIDLQFVGAQAINHVWGPVLMWTLCALAWLALARWLPARLPQLRLDGAVGMMMALPVALLAAWLLPDSVGTILAVIETAEPARAAQTVATVTPSSSLSASGSLSWLSWVGGLSLVLAVVPVLAVLRLARSWWHLNRIIRRAEILEDGRVRVCQSEDVSVPFSAGLLRPAVVLPALLDKDDRATVIRHELAHIDHGDLWRTWLTTIIRDLFAFHPLAHVLHRETALYAEICCDRRVLDAMPRQTASYARLLLRQSPSSSRLEPALLLASSPSQLRQRIEAMKTPSSLSLSRSMLAAWVVLITLSVGLLAGCSDMEVGPTEADIPDVTNEAYDLVMDLPAYKGGGNEVFSVVEEAPILLGGLEELQRRITYPERAEKAGIQGRVFLQFVVDQEGDVQDPQVVRGIGGGADEEALRALQTMKFVPGVQRGQRVKVKMSIPVTFRLDEAETPITLDATPASSGTEVRFRQIAVDSSRVASARPTGQRATEDLEFIQLDAPPPPVRILTETEEN